ncbi:unnamed protein product [Pleuronectes platessa]|uniref:DUF6729 domain-containing protein n=1 Tax=Pleuronectes platessa TaxID=8262 RepID=A0A9N7UQP0_PLEPL|nr:unnamed protein product [Pleuronectes platessa]
MYNMVTEKLSCTKCRSSHVSCSETVLTQLVLAHKSEFRVILKQKFACDIRVIRNLRERDLGNSPTQLLKPLKENHTEELLSRAMMYTTECVDFHERPTLLPLSFPEPPEPAVVPSCRLLSVYSKDILTRLDDVKARITSTYGNVLKMDSLKKITKKLAGTAKGTAKLLTSVGKEYGQVLISVMTAQEGAGLDLMAAGLVKRYQLAGVDPPVALYVDCGCCTEAGETKLKARFSGWPDIIIRLDIWHFMRRLAVGCTTDTHQLYPGFMSRLSASIFEWDAADLAMLREAKRQQLRSQGLPSLTDGVIDKQLSREEMALHCRRRTRGEETTIRLVEELLGLLMGSRGTSANSLNFQIYLLEGLHRWNHDRGAAALSTGPSSLRCYSGDLVQGLNDYYQKLFGKKVVPEFCPPSRYTGELIGMQYLFRQTGQALQDMHPDSEEAVTLIEQHDVEDDTEQDEGFADIIEDPTVLNLGVPQASAPQTSDPSAISSSLPSLVTGTSTLAPGTSTLPPRSSSVGLYTEASGSSSENQDDIHAEDEDMAVDEQNLPGYQHVDSLAEYLVELRDQTSLCLSNQQASRIVSLWDNLNPRDKQRVVYAARHQERLLSGRFRTPKKPSKTPGVESTTRCMLGASSTPAQWPDCCRLVETIFIRLCNIHQSPTKKGKKATSRWSLILRDYRKIRQLLVGNCRVMQGSEIQLVEVNQSTLIQWHNNRQRKQELSVLLQGTALPPALAESDEPLQGARVLPAAPTPARNEHQYRLPQSTAGQAKQRQTGSGQLPVNIRPKEPVKRQLYATPPAPAPGPIITPHIFTPSGLVQVVFPLPVGSFPQTSAPTSTVEAGPTPKRPYRRTVTGNTCKKCGQFRTSVTGHSQYHGKVYCPQFEALMKDQWLEEMRKNM